jgi:hypothetical protein
MAYCVWRLPTCRLKTASRLWNVKVREEIKNGSLRYLFEFTLLILTQILVSKSQTSTCRAMHLCTQYISLHNRIPLSWTPIILNLLLSRTKNCLPWISLTLIYYWLSWILITSNIFHLPVGCSRKWGPAVKISGCNMKYKFTS